MDKQYVNKLLKETYEMVCNNYLKVFCEKHDMEYDPDCWDSHEIGTTAWLGDIAITMYNIRYDVDNNIEVGKFEDWYFKGLDYMLTGKDDYLTFKSYCKGAPEPQSELSTSHPVTNTVRVGEDAVRDNELHTPYFDIIDEDYCTDEDAECEYERIRKKYCK